MKSTIWRTHDRQTILITIIFATKPRGLYPKTAKIEKRDNKEIEENEKANKRRPNNQKPSNDGQDLGKNPR